MHPLVQLLRHGRVADAGLTVPTDTRPCRGHREIAASTDCGLNMTLEGVNGAVGCRAGQAPVPEHELHPMLLHRHTMSRVPQHRSNLLMPIFAHALDLGMNFRHTLDSPAQATRQWYLLQRALKMSAGKATRK